VLVQQTRTANLLLHASFAKQALIPQLARPNVAFVLQAWLTTTAQREHHASIAKQEHIRQRRALRVLIVLREKQIQTVTHQLYARCALPVLTQAVEKPVVTPVQQERQI
jgi:hypothetical protein